MRKQTYYKVGDHTFCISALDCVDIVTLLPSLQPFEQQDSSDSLFTLSLSELPLLTLDGATELTRFEWEGAECVINTTVNNQYEIIIYPHGDSALQRKMHINKEMDYAKVELLHNATDSFALNNFLMMLYAFVTALHGTLMFHASVIRHCGQGYLFLGKSGTGKSTHSRLWLEHIEGAELLNDDNPIVRYFPDGRVTVYGSPWSGKTPCYRNESVPVGAFVRLHQAPENKITRERPARAFASLLPSCSCLRQNEEQYNHICNTITAVASTIPVYDLECRPDEEAANLCFTTVTQG
ncbi:hypothetical protein D0T50_06970 [Bacteroides sp. 214]|uniref:hypothetical protein n=1 Tax=Bacteroides sp. 214 TaxID=2302935 RepID=UPI0013D5236C|nr:hypothetical protein [Bacteroides sp. 214]NDW12630.1 hypothetical protein [Bacteroides sp. 214]